MGQSQPRPLGTGRREEERNAAMGRRIEDHALIGDTQTAALVAKDGEHRLAVPAPVRLADVLRRPARHRRQRALVDRPVPVRSVRRRYRPQTLVLETEFVTDEGVVRLTDAMPIRGESPVVVRLVQCVTGRVPMHLELVVRFLLTVLVPWVHSYGGRWAVVAGPDALVLDTPVHLQGQDLTTVADFTLSAGEDAALRPGLAPLAPAGAGPNRPGPCPGRSHGSRTTSQGPRRCSAPESRSRT